jgi:hypothetical protein
MMTIGKRVSSKDTNDMNQSPWAQWRTLFSVSVGRAMDTGELPKLVAGAAAGGIRGLP